MFQPPSKQNAKVKDASIVNYDTKLIEVNKKQVYDLNEIEANKIQIESPARKIMIKPTETDLVASDSDDDNIFLNRKHMKKVDPDHAKLKEQLIKFEVKTAQIEENKYEE